MITAGEYQLSIQTAVASIYLNIIHLIDVITCNFTFLLQSDRRSISTIYDCKLMYEIICIFAEFRFWYFLWGLNDK